MHSAKRLGYWNVLLWVSHDIPTFLHSYSMPLCWTCQGFLRPDVVEIEIWDKTINFLELWREKGRSTLKFHPKAFFPLV